MNIRVECKRVRYRVRGVPTERVRAHIFVDDIPLGQILGPQYCIEALLHALEAGAPHVALRLGINNDPRQDRHSTGSELREDVGDDKD